jgi:allophanate hydrolase
MRREAQSGALPGLAALVAAHEAGARDPAETIACAAAAARADTHAAWIHVLSDEELRPYVEALGSAAESSQATRPLLGVPFAIKDNIDLAGVPTTAGCPAFAYVPTESAPIVERLVRAGAVPIGKTNLDQFATGLVGVRSPYGETRNACAPDWIAGGSSSGSAVAVARGQVSFALGTDTAGSGRIPAAFNNVYGHKPTRGWLSTRGVVPACRSLDCVSVFARDAAEAADVLTVAGAYDARDAFARAMPSAPAPPPPGEPFSFGVVGLRALEPIDPEHARLYGEAIAALTDAGGTPREVDPGCFFEAARLLYDGPWLAERLTLLEDLLAEQPEAVHPVTRSVLEGGRRHDAVAAFHARHRLAECARAAAAALSGLELLMLPTAPTIHTLAQVAADPIARNAELGRFTNFANLLDLAVAAVPAGFRRDGLPFGVSLFAPAGHDARLLQRAEALQRARTTHAGAELPLPPCRAPRLVGGPWTDLAVCGAHLSGQPLNRQLTERGAVRVASTRTVPGYRLYLLPGGKLARPALVRGAGSHRIEIEVWRLPTPLLGSFLEGIAPPLGLGTVDAETEPVLGFVCEEGGTAGARDITHFGGWKAWLASAAPAGAGSAQAVREERA